MRILVLYNDFRSFGGEDKVVHETIALLRERGHVVTLNKRSSKNLGPMEKARAFFGGMFNVFSYRRMLKTLDDERPDVVHVHNLYPFFSPSVIVASRRVGVPVVMTLHNFGLTCPHWSHFRRGQICERCAGGTSYWCMLKNCQENVFESIGYAIRSDLARRFGLFRRYVSAYIAMTKFAKDRFVRAGYPAGRIAVIPNKVEVPSVAANVRDGAFVAYAGRISEEKGVGCLLSAARRLPNIAFEVAGDGPLMENLRVGAPRNVVFRGRLNAAELAAFYRKARILVVPSTCFEMCPTVLLEGMAMALPVVASNIGGLPEFVSDGKSGLLFEPANSEDLAAKIRMLWNDPDSSVRLGQSARQWTESECSESVYFDRLMAVYRESDRRAAAPVTEV